MCAICTDETCPEKVGGDFVREVYHTALHKIAFFC